MSTRRAFFSSIALLFIAASWPGCKCSCGNDGTHFESSADEPTELASKVSMRRMAIDDKNVYWTDWGDGMSGDHSKNGAIKRIDKTGKGDSESVYPAQSHPAGIALDATSIYWTDEGDDTVKKAPKSSGGVITTLTSEIKQPVSIAVDGSDVFVGTMVGQIWKVDAAGGKATKVVQADGDVRRLIVDGDGVVFSTDHGEIGRIAKSGGSTTLLAKAQSSKVMFDLPLALDASNVYFASGNEAMSVAKHGGSPSSAKKIYGGTNGIMGIAADGTNVYVTDGSTLVRIPPSGAAARVDDVSLVEGLETDGAFLYWTEGIMDKKLLRKDKNATVK